MGAVLTWAPIAPAHLSIATLSADMTGPASTKPKSSPGLSSSQHPARSRAGSSENITGGLVDSSQRTTRSRNNSTSDGTSDIYFDKPCTISKPGKYALNGPTSGCQVLLFDNIFQSEELKFITACVGALPALKVLSNAGGHPLPRLSAWYGPADYTYSGLTMTAQPVTDVPVLLSVYKAIADDILKPNAVPTNADSFLVNLYRNEKDSCGEHADNEPIVNQKSPIVTLSLGSTRCMMVREASKPNNAVRFTLKPGSVLVMCGPQFQSKFLHQIPKENKASSPRSSVTWRESDPTFLAKLGVTSTPIYNLKQSKKLP